MEAVKAASKGKERTNRGAPLCGRPSERPQPARDHQLECGQVGAQSQHKGRLDGRCGGLGGPHRTGASRHECSILRPICIVSGILLLVQALSAFDPTSITGDGRRDTAPPVNAPARH